MMEIFFDVGGMDFVGKVKKIIESIAYSRFFKQNMV